jgi:large subunit ribosomal protein L32e
MAEKKVSLPQKPLKARKRAKKKKPDFVRPESWRYIKLKESWRRPRGLDHKVRRKIKGWPPGVSVGYKGPKVARGLHPSGYREVLVHNAKEVSVIDPKTEAARIAHTVGKRKRVQIITEAKKREVFILNFKPVKETAEEEKEEEEEGVEETEAAEEKSEKKPAAEKKKVVKKEAAKPKRALPARQKSSPKEQKPQKKAQKAPAKGSAKKAEKPKKQPKKPRRKAKAEGGAEK